MKYVKDILISILVISAVGLTGCLYPKNNPGEKDPPDNPIKSNEKTQSIDSVEKVKLGGTNQWIYVTGNDNSKPVLLFLHGGPGYAMMPLLHTYNSYLEKYFTVVNWDQRGAGLSFSPNIPEESMNLKQFVSDTHELTLYLKKRFKQEKIFLAGHSFGTVLGMEAIYNYPNDYQAFVGIGQVVSFASNEQLSYDFALKSAKEANNNKAVKELTRIGRPDANGNYKDDSGYEITVSWVEYYGGSIYGKTSTGDLENIILSSQIYKDNIEKVENGWSFSDLLFDDKEVRSLDFRSKIKSVDVPVYFFEGTYDYETPFELVKEYFNILKAPSKELIWFENSAHFPFYEEPQKFNEIMINKVLSNAILSKLPGEWEGTYTTNQASNKMRLNIQKTDDSSYWAEFKFETSNSLSGSYKILISYDSVNNTIVFTGNEWINKPVGFEMIHLRGNISDNSLKGTCFLNDGITYTGTFSVVKDK